ncbi:hypothetical protein COO60DRAFT_364115 [Scenedesmus sp. NREL 46B-D3]|nr:hypothetical protein COO60DRAFT_364115 [Scenedesmus sp. NREL 46B-D3]
MSLKEYSALPKHDRGAAGQLQRVLNFLGRNPVQKTDKPVRIGVLGASQVATYALIWPAKRIAEVEVAAVAARDRKRAADYAKKHGIPVAYGSYQQLVDDPSLTAIYVATPNGLHGDWAEAALRAGRCSCAMMEGACTTPLTGVQSPCLCVAYGYWTRSQQLPTLDVPALTPLSHMRLPATSLHCWCIELCSLWCPAAGKHVLCEKPFTANAEEARSVQSAAAKRKLLCREAFHYKEHPANKAVAELLQSGAIGQLKQLAVQVLIPAWAFLRMTYASRQGWQVRQA